MTDISFYHLTTRSLEDALPKLLELSLQSEERALVLLGNEKRMEFLNGLLWTYEPGSWLPHGTLEDGDPADQPIFLTSRDENLNEATFLFLVDGAVSENLTSFKRVFDLFNGRDEEAVKAARNRWSSYKRDGHSLLYWKQDETGRWTKT
jgi:DNA polymerase-3 subunit chi|tara:strand:- start:282 stop:728 length:447 start_codon:yes stop_codon:yes gene_type:complete